MQKPLVPGFQEQRDSKWSQCALFFGTFARKKETLTTKDGQPWSGILTFVSVTGYYVSSKIADVLIVPKNARNKTILHVSNPAQSLLEVIHAKRQVLLNFLQRSASSMPDFTQLTPRIKSMHVPDPHILSSNWLGSPTNVFRSRFRSMTSNHYRKPRLLMYARMCL